MLTARRATRLQQTSAGAIDFEQGMAVFFSDEQPAIAGSPSESWPKKRLAKPDPFFESQLLVKNEPTAHFCFELGSWGYSAAL